MPEKYVFCRIFRRISIFHGCLGRPGARRRAGQRRAAGPLILNIYAGWKMARCRGCFGCWLKTPGECVLRDGSERIGPALMSGDRVYILSRSCYGGFFVETKRALDRCIAGVLPFFICVGGLMHYVPRFCTQSEYRVAFYGMAGCTGREKATAVKAAKAMSMNFNAKRCTVRLFDGEITAKEAAEL